MTEGEMTEGEMTQTVVCVLKYYSNTYTDTKLASYNYRS